MENEFIFEDLDVAEKAYLAKHGASPSVLELDIYTYLTLKEALGLDDFEELNYYHGTYKIVVDVISEDRTLRFL